MPHPRAAQNSANASRQAEHFWTAERVERLRALWGEGLLAHDIAAAIGGGCTSDMVIGKANRLHLPARSPSEFWRKRCKAIRVSRGTSETHA